MSGGRFWLLLATIGGLAVAGWMLSVTGMDKVLDVIGRFGVGGFLAYCAYSLGTVALLGGAWASAAPPLGIRDTFLLFGWARLVREAAADILPFSQVGGLVIGVRLLIARAIPAPLVNASVLVDLATEMAAQVVFTLFGIAGFVVLRSGAADSDMLMTPILIGTLVMTGLMAAFFLAQSRMLRVAELLLERMLPAVSGGIADARAELARIYAQPGRVALALAFNLAAWVASAAGAWIALVLMGVKLPLVTVLVMESLIFVLRSVAFALPGAIGVQEVAYVLLGPLLGLPAEEALALSLAKRARDLVIGVPALVAWQASEARALSATRSGVAGGWARPNCAVKPVAEQGRTEGEERK
jgi:putative membrane protein